VTPWAITRAADDAAAQCETLRAAGVPAFPLPCVELTLRPVPEWKPTGTPVVLLTSKTALLAVRPALTGFPGLLAALSPQTSEAASASGLTVHVEAEGGAVSLARAVVAHLQHAHVSTPAFWYPTSDVGLQSDEQTEAVALLEALGPVTRPAVYETRAPSTLRTATPPERFHAFFASPSAVEHFLSARLPAPQRVACWGHSTYVAARPHFPQAVEVSRHRPLAESLVEQEQPHV
jgi:uroporphyrinogen-III synthase